MFTLPTSFAFVSAAGSTKRRISTSLASRRRYRWKLHPWTITNAVPILPVSSHRTNFYPDREQRLSVLSKPNFSPLSHEFFFSLRYFVLFPSFALPHAIVLLSVTRRTIVDRSSTFSGVFTSSPTRWIAICYQNEGFS